MNVRFDPKRTFTNCLSTLVPEHRKKRNMDTDQLNRWLTLGVNIGIIVGIVFLAIEMNQYSAVLEQNIAVSTAQTVSQVNQSLDASYRILAQK